MARLPVPLTDADRAAGYWWELSMRQIEVSRTIVFDQPRNGRAFFEALVADNLDLGRPEQVELIFGRQDPADRTTTGVFATRVVTRGVDVTVNVGYKHSRIKQYLKDGRALRIETVINDPTTSACSAAWSICPNCRPRPVPSTAACSILNVSVRAVSLRVQPLSGSRNRPSVDGRRAPALRFGDPRVMALVGALAVSRPPDRRLHQQSLRPW